MLIGFTKMHGLGNDYVLIDERDEEQVPDSRKADFARRVCRRGFAVGSDGVLYLSTPEDEDVQMRIFNPDGSEAESCGNGLRCTAYYHHGLNKPGQSTLTINLPLADTVGATVHYRDPPSARVRLNLGEAGRYEDTRELRLPQLNLNYHRVDAGNPHAVFFLDENPELDPDLDSLPLRDIGPRIQSHDDFENTGGINAEFVVEKGENAVRMRVHERGVGETSSCGTGCIAIARACAQTGRASGWVEVEQPGGILRIQTEDGLMEGPAEFSYRGELRVEAESLHEEGG